VAHHCAETIKELTYVSFQWAYGCHFEEANKHLVKTSVFEDSKEAVQSFLENDRQSEKIDSIFPKAMEVRWPKNVGRCLSVSRYT